MKPTEYLKQFLLLLRGQVHTQIDLRKEYERILSDVRALTPENPAIYGYKIYSQCDEDGIIANIFSRIGSNNNIFVELGCGNGLENNTHALALKGWRGVWIDADKDNIKYINRFIQKNSRLIVKREFISEDNVVDILKSSLDLLDVESIDFFSIDIDSNDIYVLNKLLKQIKPRVVCVEYNSKFPPPMEISVQRRQSTWSGDDYQSASLCSFVRVLHNAGYRLIACSLSGVNAFFVRGADAENFPSFTVEELYKPARYYLIKLESGHRPSLKFLADTLSEPHLKTVPSPPRC